MCKRAGTPLADAGYVKYALFQAILDAGSSFVIRLGCQPVEEVLEERPLSDAARAAGVVADRLVRLGSPSRGGALQQPVRIVEVVVQGRDGPQTLRLVTDRLDLPAEVVALAYRYRWQIERFFRWFKCVLGCRHLLSTAANGVRIQVYVALIVGLLISLWTGRKPSKRTLEMIQLYLGGWASWKELWAHITSLPPRPGV
jgi:IS4 transposase